MENLLIICEKNSAAKNFEKALGGMSGSFEGDNYQIVHLSGHVLKLPEPKKTARTEYAKFIGDFRNVQSAPWKFDYFDFDNYVPIGSDKADKCSDYLSKGYIPVIATDLDSFCEGDLIGYEVLRYLNYRGKIYREFHADESPNSIIKALKNKKPITMGYTNFNVGRARQASDYVTQCLTRVATYEVMQQGYTIGRSIPFGRLKSAVLSFIGSQQDAIRNYKPSTMYEFRYKLDDLVLKMKDAEQFKTVEEMEQFASQFPMDTKVKKVQEIPGTTPPPKLLNIDKLGSIFTNKGVSITEVRETAQVLYDNSILSYPRTEENVISMEDFKVITPHIDKYINLLGLHGALFTHREPRKTHVVDATSHGGLRPGVVIPKSLDDLKQYGKIAVEMYKIVTEEFLKMYLEDTEWIRYEFVTETKPEFKGSVRIITKQGVLNLDDNVKDVVSTLPNLSKLAVGYPHEVKSVKPKTPTIAWTLDQLKKYDIGTPATRLTTLEGMIGNEAKPLMLESKRLVLSKVGLLGYEAAKETIIGSPEGTKELQNLLFSLGKNEKTMDEVFYSFEEMLASDINVLRNKIYSLEQYGFVSDRVAINWLGKDITIKRKCGTYEYTPEDLEKLSRGEEISFKTKDSNNVEFNVTGKIDTKISKKTNKPYTEFIGKYERADKVKGVWNGREISFKKTWRDYEFTQSELDKLFKGEKIVITLSDGQRVEGALKDAEYKGYAYVAFDGKYVRDESKRYKGIWNGREVDIPRKWSTYEFSDEELKRLVDGELITINYRNKYGYTNPLKGRLEEQEYNSTKFVGFKPIFDKKDD